MKRQPPGVKKGAYFTNLDADTKDSQILWFLPNDRHFLSPVGFCASDSVPARPTPDNLPYSPRYRYIIKSTGIFVVVVAAVLVFVAVVIDRKRTGGPPFCAREPPAAPTPPHRHRHNNSLMAQHITSWCAAYDSSRGVGGGRGVGCLGPCGDTLSLLRR